MCKWKVILVIKHSKGSWNTVLIAPGVANLSLYDLLACPARLQISVEKDKLGLLFEFQIVWFNTYILACSPSSPIWCKILCSYLWSFAVNLLPLLLNQGSLGRMATRSSIWKRSLFMCLCGLRFWMTFPEVFSLSSPRDPGLCFFGRKRGNKEMGHVMAVTSVFDGLLL